MSRSSIPKPALKVLRAIKGKRARVVIDHILKHGSITTEQLQEEYGYEHPPRAIRDVLDQGVPLVKTTAKNKSGRRIAEYRFGDLTKIRAGRIGGRRAFPKAFKTELLAKHGHRCAICGGTFEPRYLQIDHRVPYEICGDAIARRLDTEDFMPVCGSCNRAKSWSCEHCMNWTELKAPEKCRSCYWANPTSYAHVALCDVRRLDLIWAGVETHEYDILRKDADDAQRPMPQYVKEILGRMVLGERPPGG